MPRGIRIQPVPHCPDCGAQMVLRRPRPSQDWKPFWGCSQYDACKGSRNIREDGTPEDDRDLDYDNPYMERYPIDSDDLPF